MIENKILVTGGGGYVGSVLVPKLLRAGYFVRALDLFLYEKDPFKDVNPEWTGRLEILKGDIRRQGIIDFACMDIDTVIHLACISNDPSFDLNPTLGKSINLDAFEPFVKVAKDSGVSRFISASSSSVYGVSEDPVVTEDSGCLPLTDYSKYKLMTESILLDYEEPHFTTCSIRSATVCGHSPRQRLDVIVNILTNHAHHKGIITVNGGPQKRPNVHIEDLANLYLKLIEVPSPKIAGEIFNFGGPNHTVDELALLVKKMYFGRPVQIVHKDTNDPRSYHISSEKIKTKLGIEPKFGVEQAIADLKTAFEFNKLPNSLHDSKYFNVERIKELGLK